MPQAAWVAVVGAYSVIVTAFAWGPCSVLSWGLALNLGEFWGSEDRPEAGVWGVSPGGSKGGLGLCDSDVVGWHGSHSLAGWRGA